MTDEIIQIERKLFEKMLEQIINTDMYSHGSNINAEDIYLELRSRGLWFKME